MSKENELDIEIIILIGWFLLGVFIMSLLISRGIIK